MNRRIFVSKNGTISDFSSAMDDYKGSNKVFNNVAGQDYIFIGTRLPLNHIFFKLSSLNTIANVMTSEYWDGKQWQSFVEVQDDTLGFTQSGYLTFTPNRDKPWQMSNTNYGNQTVTGLETLNVYDLYWVRISFSQNFRGQEVDPETDPITYEDVSLQWIGNLFSNDYDLEGEYPDFVRDNVMNAFSSGKTDWIEQAVIAGRMIVDNLCNRAVIDDPNQVLNREDYRLASVHKVAEIICNAFGDDYVDQKKMAREEYNARMNRRIQKVDVNRTGREELPERYNSMGWISR